MITPSINLPVQACVLLWMKDTHTHVHREGERESQIKCASREEAQVTNVCVQSVTKKERKKERKALSVVK